MERPQTSINTGFAAIFYHFYLQKSGYITWETLLQTFVLDKIINQGCRRRQKKNPSLRQPCIITHFLFFSRRRNKNTA